MSKRPAWPGLRRASGESDDQLIEKVRSGDSSGFDELYRRHRAAAESTARWMLRSRGDVDDVVADAFAGVLAAIRNGNGPRDNFRAYLLAAVRNGCRSRGHRLVAAHSPREDAGDPMFEDPERYVEADTVARAFASLNPRWQQTLWLTEVEQRSPAEVAARMDLAPNATAALTLRAREAFATAYLAEHVSGSPDEVCERYGPRLAAYVRDQLTDLQRDEIDRHLVECPRCQMAVNELSDVNASLRKLLPPADSGAHRTVDCRHARHDVESVQLRAAAQGGYRASRRDPAARQHHRRRSWRSTGRPGGQGGRGRAERAGTRVRAGRGHRTPPAPRAANGRAERGYDHHRRSPPEVSKPLRPQRRHPSVVRSPDPL